MGCDNELFQRLFQFMEMRIFFPCKSINFFHRFDPQKSAFESMFPQGILTFFSEQKHSLIYWRAEQGFVALGKKHLISTGTPGTKIEARPAGASVHKSRVRTRWHALQAVSSGGGRIQSLTLVPTRRVQSGPSVTRQVCSRPSSSKSMPSPPRISAPSNEMDDTPRETPRGFSTRMR